MASWMDASVCQTWLATASLMKEPLFLHRVELRTIRRQGEQMHAGWDGRVSCAGMKAGLVPDHHMLGARIALLDLLQEPAAGFQADAVAKERLRAMRPIDFQCRMEAAPLVLGVIGRLDPRTAQAPATAHNADQSKAMFIGHL